jgi:Protein of unknown function (DUF3443)
MRLLSRATARPAPFIALAVATVILAGCGGGGGSNTITVTPPVNNTQAVQVNFGPANNLVNGLFTTVTVCVPGSTTQCQTITDVQVDTGSEGLRLLSSVVTVPLPTVSDNSSNVLQECVQFADLTYAWGPVVSADIQMAGERGSSVPIQLIAASPAFAVPADCSNGAGTDSDLNTVTSLGANGILGVGNFRQDCGSFCTSAASGDSYYLCPNSACGIASVPLNFQLQNPVWTFPQDNNGLLISLPAVPDTGSPTVSGTMIFGIGTQTDNALGSAQVYTTDGVGDFRTTYNGIQYGGTTTSQSYIDSGSNGLYILDSNTLGQGMQDCTDPNLSGFYCPAATTSFTATNTGLNGTTGSVTFKIASAAALSPANAALNDLGGPNPLSFDYGMPFFYGRPIFVGIEGQTGPTGVVGPYWAY